MFSLTQCPRRSLVVSAVSLFAIASAWQAPFAVVPGPPVARAIGAPSLRRMEMEKARKALEPGRMTIRGLSGMEARESAKGPSLEVAKCLLARLESCALDSSRSLSQAAFSRVMALLPGFRADVGLMEQGTLDPSRYAGFEDEMVLLQNEEGRMVKGDAVLSFVAGPGAKQAGRGGMVESAPVPGAPQAVAKVNTGWILDQHIYDDQVAKFFPTVPSDIRHYDEGRGAMAMGSDGLVWEVQSLYWTDTTTVADHPTPSYCLAVFYSSDGGATWVMWGLLYDSSSKDLIAPALAIDITGATNRLFIAYERVYSPSDHDIYVYSESLGATPNPQTASIATSVLMEENPALASDYTTGQTAYRVVVYDKEFTAGGSDYDLYAAQSTGAGAQADWSAPVTVANTANKEWRPGLASGASGGASFTAYMHAAYNYDTETPLQLLLNPGFESGDDGSWVRRVPGDISCNGVNMRTGTCKGWLGGTLSQPNDWMYQTVTIPPDALTAQLVYYLKIVSADSTTVAYDFGYAEVRDSSGSLLKSLSSYSNADQATYATYAVQQFNLMEFKGQTIRIHFWASNDATNTTSFYLDDTAVNVTTPATGTAHEVRYARAQHPGATPYPNGLQAATKVTVLANTGATWTYGPPSVAASHGGSATMTPSRVVVAAEQAFPANAPNTGDPARNQLTFAWNTCNGATTCGSVTCTPANITLNWQEAYFYDGKADEQAPSLITDGSGLGTDGVALHPLIFMAYYHRDQLSPLPGGQAIMIVTDASDESCTGFPSGAWGYFTASPKASDDDDLVVTTPKTLVAYNYWDGYPGVSFNKSINHFGGTQNEDVYTTTLGDNYTFDTYSGPSHIDAGFSLNTVHYVGPWTFPWAAGYAWAMTADSSAISNFRYYTFSSWSTGATTPGITVTSDWCDGVNPCPTLNYTASYDGGCLIDQQEVTGVQATKQGANVSLAWDPPAQAGDVGQYTIYRATSPTAASNFTSVGTSATNAFKDSTAPGAPYYYLVVAQCGPYSGPWGAYGQ